MAANGSPQQNRKPLQVMQINRREDEQDRLQREAAEARAAADAAAEKARQLEEAAGLSKPVRPAQPSRPQSPGASLSDEERFGTAELEGMSMADLLGAPDDKPRSRPPAEAKSERQQPRSVDDFDFDEEAFLAALDEKEPVGTTGEVVSGTVIGLESDGVYVDIGGKAPGFMPKSEAGLGVITNFRERFPKGLEIEVLVTREQNADGMVTISCRALALRKSWDRVKEMEKQGKVVQVIVNGFNRGGVTCDLEGLRGFIPRSQLQDGENHQDLVGKSSAWPSWRSTLRRANLCCRRNAPLSRPCSRTSRSDSWWKGRWHR